LKDIKTRVKLKKGRKKYDSNADMELKQVYPTKSNYLENMYVALINKMAPLKFSFKYFFYKYSGQRIFSECEKMKFI
jgi:hypothetical protein